MRLLKENGFFWDITKNVIELNHCASTRISFGNPLLASKTRGSASERLILLVCIIRTHICLDGRSVHKEQNRERVDCFYRHPDTLAQMQQKTDFVSFHKLVFRI